jgi:N-hydroxyarylamine O-acetyltransferase
MDIQIYLDRIDYHGARKPDFATLLGLHRAHMLAVPFENLDIVPLRRPIHLDWQALWDKIIVHQRGGFCYELNGQFAWLLKQIGFDVTYLNARVYEESGERGRDFDHLALQVKIPGHVGRWLADVGFGDSFVEPLTFKEGAAQTQGLRAYRLEAVEGGLDMWQREYNGKWQRQYFFDLMPRKFPDDYEATCHYHQTSPQSSFTRAAVISIATLEGRITLDQDKLIVTEKGRRKERPVSREERPYLLQKYFGVVL